MTAKVFFAIRMILFTVIMGVQLWAQVALTKTVTSLNILPKNFYTIFLACMGVALLFTILLLFVKQSSRFFWRFLRTILAALICVCMVLAGKVGVDLGNTLNSSLTEVSAATHPGSVIGIYVRTDDPAQVIEDARTYSFGFGEDFDPADSRKAVYEIEQQLKSTISLTTQGTVLDSIDALYEGTCDAMIMNRVYEDVLAGTEGNEEGDYSDFSSRTRLLCEIELVDSEIDRAFAMEEGMGETQAEEVMDEPLDVTKDPFVVYLSGSDTRSTMLTTSRSDVNILAVVNPAEHQVLLVNTPRDFYVHNSISPEGSMRDKLTHCGIYGIHCSMDTLSQLYGIPVNYYAQINFTGFEKLIDAVGGVDVYSEVSYGYEGGPQIREGENHLNGSEALFFAQERHKLAGGDNDRGRNQMKVIRALIDKFTSPSILQRYADILKSLEGMMLTDFGTENFAALVRLQLSDGGKWDVLSCAATGSNASDYTYSMPRTKLYVMEPDQTRVDMISQAIRLMLDGNRISSDNLK